MADSLFTEYLFQEGIGQHQVIVSLDDFPVEQISSSGHLIGHLFIVVIIHRQRFSIVFANITPMITAILCVNSISAVFIVSLRRLISA